jgi:Spy/CpxP family protein refolding chaperone
MRARLHADAMAILTPEQKAELTAQRDRMRQWWQSRPAGAGPGGRGKDRPAL